MKNLAVTHVESHNGVFQEADTVFECEVRLGRRREYSRCRRGAELEYWIHSNRDSSKFHYSLFKANVNLSRSVLSTGVCFKASDWCQKLNRTPLSAGITLQMLTKNTLALLVVMAPPVEEENTKYTHHRGDEETMRTLETSKQTNDPVCKYPVTTIFQLNWASAEIESTGIQLIFVWPGCLRREDDGISRLLASFLLLEG